MIVRPPTGFIEPCQPSKVTRPPSGALWVHEIKHDGYRLMVRRDGERTGEGRHHVPAGVCSRGRAAGKAQGLGRPSGQKGPRP
jgi:hypothetical protein